MIICSLAFYLRDLGYLKKGNNMKIAAVVYISLSEIQQVIPGLTKELAQADKETTNKYLYQLGMDTSMPIEEQDVIHRNRFNQVVDTLRFVGMERLDNEWLSSGHASQEALDKAKNNKILTALYARKGMVDCLIEE